MERYAPYRLTDRGINTAVETGQEVLQETATIAGVQLGSKIDTGEWTYSAGEVFDRLADTTANSALTFGLTNLPAIGNNIYVQSHAKLVADGYAKLRSGELPNDAELNAMGISRPEALGMAAVFEMEKQENAAEGSQTTGQTIEEISNETKPYATSRPSYGKDRKNCRRSIL